MRTSIVFDIETVPHDCAATFVPKPDLSTITAAKNLKDPVKVDEDIKRRQTEALADYDAKLSRCGLDWNLNRIVAIGWVTEESGDIFVLPVRDEAEEAAALETFWTSARNHDYVGFAARTFDLPVLIQRSRLLNVRHPNLSLARFGKGDVTDLHDVLTFDDARYEAIMPRTLKAFCQRFGIPVNDDVSGADMAQLIADGQWDAVLAHCASDVRLTMELAMRLRLFTLTPAGAF